MEKNISVSVMTLGKQLKNRRGTKKWLKKAYVLGTPYKEAQILLSVNHGEIGHVSTTSVEYLSSPSVFFVSSLAYQRWSIFFGYFVECPLFCQVLRSWRLT